MEEWRPGSFTKNYSWGPKENGLKHLYEAIRVGFDYKLEPVTRAVFRQRIARLNRPDFIPINFFLLNEEMHGSSFLVVDELVFQAMTFKHSGQFDKLALFAFNFSNVGRWKGAYGYQKEPALWARRYVEERVADHHRWNTGLVSADDIESFVGNDRRYVAKTSRKLATNLNYLYENGKLRDLASPKPERWWLSAIFLALDRSLLEPPSDVDELGQAKLLNALTKAGFWKISGKRSVEKEIAANYFVALYQACAGRSRFSIDEMSTREAELVPQHISNEEPTLDGVGVLHPTNPNSRNAIPHAARVLARYLAGFIVFELDDFESFDAANFIRSRTEGALRELREKGISPAFSGDEIVELTRGKP